MRLRRAARSAGVFTQNRFCAAPVLAREEAPGNERRIRALVVNTGNANAGTGEDGLSARAAGVRSAGRALLGCDAEQVLPFSTGVIMEPLPVERIVAGLPQALLAPRTTGASAAEAIMTTDTVPKAVSREGQAVHGRRRTVTGIAKGAGMIRPTWRPCSVSSPPMPRVAGKMLSAMLAREVADQSFNCITRRRRHLDQRLVHPGRHRRRARHVDLEARPRSKLEAALTDVARQLAQAIVRDGEGATKFITMRVEGGRNATSAARSPTRSRTRRW